MSMQISLKNVFFFYAALVGLNGQINDHYIWTDNISAQ